MNIMSSPTAPDMTVTDQVTPSHDRRAYIRPTPFVITRIMMDLPPITRKLHQTSLNDTLFTSLSEKNNLIT